MDLDNELPQILQCVDKDFWCRYVQNCTVYPTFTTTPSLTVQQLQEAIQDLVEDQKEYTHTFWRDIALKHISVSPHLLMVCSLVALTHIEDTFHLDPTCRPGWAKPSTHLPDAAHVFFLRCLCICHEPPTTYSVRQHGKRTLLENGDWCCTCSAYEDIE